MSALKPPKKRSLSGERGSEDRTVRYEDVGRLVRPVKERGNEDITVHGEELGKIEEPTVRRSDLDMHALRNELSPANLADISMLGNEDPTVQSLVPDDDIFSTPPQASPAVEPTSEDDDGWGSGGASLDDLDEILGFEFEHDDWDQDSVPTVMGNANLIREVLGAVTETPARDPAEEATDRDVDVTIGESVSDDDEDLFLDIELEALGDEDDED